MCRRVRICRQGIRPQQASLASQTLEQLPPRTGWLRRLTRAAPGPIARRQTAAVIFGIELQELRSFMYMPFPMRNRSASGHGGCSGKAFRISPKSEYVFHHADGLPMGVDTGILPLATETGVGSNDPVFTCSHPEAHVRSASRAKGCRHGVIREITCLDGH